MSLQVFQVGVFLFTVLALGSFGGIVFSVDPSVAGIPGRVLFFVSAFATLLGVMLLLMTSLYKKGLGSERAALYLGSAFRQAFLLSCYVFINLALLYREIWVWWVALLFLAFILLLEFTVRNFTTKQTTEKSV